MHIQFIDITSYKGISTNAEHYYAKVSKEDYNTDCVALSYGWNFEDCSGDLFGRELRYYPNTTTAKEYSKKDFPGDKERQDYNTSILIKEGTVRFPSVIEILKTARKEYPDAVLYVTFHGSHKEFLRRFCYGSDQHNANKEIEKLLLPKKHN